MKVLKNLVNKSDVIGILNGFIDIYEEEEEEEDEKIYNVLCGVESIIRSLHPIDIVEAGDCNIVCERAEDIIKYLEGAKNH